MFVLGLLRTTGLPALGLDVVVGVAGCLVDTGPVEYIDEKGTPSKAIFDVRVPDASTLKDYCDDCGDGVPK